MQVSLGSLQTVSATIANTATKSGAVATGGMALVGIYMPAAFTGTTITFEVHNQETGTYNPVKKSDGTALTYTVDNAAVSYVAIDPSYFYGVFYLKVVAGSAQGASRTLTLALKGM